MPLKRVGYFPFLNVYHFDLCITAPDSQALRRLIEGQSVCNSISSINTEQLLDHPNIPHFDNTVRVTGGHVLATDGEHTVIDGVQVSVEGLHG